MKIKINCTGNERKSLVATIGEVLEAKPEYKGAPTFAYDIDGFVVDKNCILTYDGDADSNVVERLIEKLAERGFELEVLEAIETGRTLEVEEKSSDTTEAPISLVIEMPRKTFTDTALENLKRLLESKGELIKKALGVEALPVETTDEKVSFPWFSFPKTDEEVKAYTHFICALSELAREQKRVTAKAKEVDNEKYAFRCFLLRLGFIGQEYKAERKILLSKLIGSSAFKSGTLKQEEVE
jgi:hypothetical protein